MIKFLREKKTDIFFILFFIIIFALASNPMPSASLAISKFTGITVKIDILLGAVISLGLLRGRKYASYYAVTCGFILDLYVGNPYAFSPIVYFLSAWLASRAAAPFARKTPLSVLLISAQLLWIRGIVSVFYLLAISGDAGALSLILRGVLPEYILNMIACAAVFSVMRIVMAIFKIPLKEDILR